MTDQYAMFLLAIKIASMATKGFLIDFNYGENVGFTALIEKDGKKWVLDRSAFYPTTTLKEFEKIEAEAKTQVLEPYSDEEMERFYPFMTKTEDNWHVPNTMHNSARIIGKKERYE